MDPGKEKGGGEGNGEKGKRSSHSQKRQFSKRGGRGKSEEKEGGIVVEEEETGNRGTGAFKGTPGDAKCVTEIVGDKDTEVGDWTKFKFGQLILWKILKIVAVRCHI